METKYTPAGKKLNLNLALRANPAPSSSGKTILHASESEQVSIDGKVMRIQVNVTEKI